MPSESERWKTGPLRNTVGHTEGATGAVTGGVEGHVKSAPLDGTDSDALRQVVTKDVEDPRVSAADRNWFDKPTFRGG